MVNSAMASNSDRDDIKLIEDWKNIVENDPNIPRSFEELIVEARSLRSAGPSIDYQNVDYVSKMHFVGLHRDLEQADIVENRAFEFPKRSSPDELLIQARRSPEPCGEERNYRILTGLQNPHLLPEQRKIVRHELDQAVPQMERIYETKHFVFRWTEGDPDTKQNVTELAVLETSEHLEAAYADIVKRFEIRPISPLNSLKLEVVFYDLGPTIRGNAYPPSGPIELNSRLWMGTPEIRKSTATHELFHKFHYAIGFRTEWKPKAQYQWFSEGTASWAEVAMCGKVSDAMKLSMLFDQPDTGLFHSSYGAAPFWIFFEATLGSNSMSELFRAMKAQNDIKGALNNVLMDTDSAHMNMSFDELYRAFTVASLLGNWRSNPNGVNLYPTILGPDDEPIATSPLIRQVQLSPSTPFSTFGLVLPYGTDYFGFHFLDREVDTFSLSFEGKPAASYSVKLVILDKQNGIQVVDVEPAEDEGKWNIEKYKCNSAQKVDVIISGYSYGASYQINVSAD